MSQSAYRVRRATVDDLGEMLALWEAMHFSTPELERRLTEFQVVESDDGGLLGAVGLEIAGRHGMIHSEGFNDFAQADGMRQELWERVQSLATNHGLARLWTQETAPFWKQNGFQSANEESLIKLPSQWAAIQSGWLTMRLRDEEALQISLDKEFARFKEEEQQRRQGVLRRNRTLKSFTTLVAVVLMIFVLVVCIYMLLHRNDLRAPGR